MVIHAGKLDRPRLPESSAAVNGGAAPVGSGGGGNGRDGGGKGKDPGRGGGGGGGGSPLLLLLLLLLAVVEVATMPFRFSSSIIALTLGNISLSFCATNSIRFRF